MNHFDSWWVSWKCFQVGRTYQLLDRIQNLERRSVRMHDMDFRERGSASVWVLLFAAAMCVMPLPGQAQIIQNIVSAKQGRAIENELAEIGRASCRVRVCQYV